MLASLGRDALNIAVTTFRNMDVISSLPGAETFRYFAVITAQTELDAVPGIKVCGRSAFQKVICGKSKAGRLSRFEPWFSIDLGWMSINMVAKNRSPS